MKNEKVIYRGDKMTITVDGKTHKKSHEGDSTFPLEPHPKDCECKVCWETWSIDDLFKS